MQLHLLTATLLAPAALALAPRRHLRLALATVLCLQLGLLALTGCLTSTLQCPFSCALLYPACENAGDGNDGAPLGIALLGLLAFGLDGAVLTGRALCRRLRASFATPPGRRTHGALVERPLNLQGAGMGPARAPALQAKQAGLRTGALRPAPRTAGACARHPASGILRCGERRVRRHAGKTWHPPPALRPMTGGCPAQDSAQSQHKCQHKGDAMSGGNWKELFHAACSGDLALVGYHTRNGVDLNYAHPEFLGTPLVACILAGQEAVALYLLEQGADPRLRSEFDGATPLQAARRAGLAGVEQRLLAMGVQEDPPAAPARQSFGRWLLRRAGLAA
ncbi:hypothetical protein [Roseateles flavus]|uniref:Ankyrin repeat domain-containing protein n=1 Tax=Roseateles flavus TaxID=3149041 RepID=A0ABV0GEG7_9BURK